MTAKTKTPCNVLFLCIGNLPLTSLDKLSLQKRLNDIGTTTSEPATHP